jgi:O-antigen/teichoic acid export membrane protein
VPVAIIVALSPLMLHLWLGPDVAANSATALRILALGVFVNAMAHPPYVFLYALGRPDLPAKFHLAELCVHIPLTWFLVTRFGVTGAASAWAIRVTFDWALLTIFARRRMEALPPRFAIQTGKVIVYCAALLLGAAASGAIAARSPAAAIAFIVIAVAGFAIISWKSALDDTERTLARSMARWYLSGLGVKVSS